MRPKRNPRTDREYSEEDKVQGEEWSDHRPLTPEEALWDTHNKDHRGYDRCPETWHGWVCTLGEGHPGDHVGGVGSQKKVAQWVAWDTQLDVGPDDGA